MNSQKNENKIAESTPEKKEAKSSRASDNPGAILKQKRLAKGIPIETVHEATKVPLDVLRAIEEGYTVKVLSPFYFKGFLKIYANYLEVNYDEILREYEKKQSAKKVEQKDSRPKRNLWQDISKAFDREKQIQVLTLIGVIIALFVFVKVVSAVVNKIKSVKKERVSVAKPIKKNKKQEDKKVKKDTSDKKEEKIVEKKEAVKKLEEAPVVPIKEESNVVAKAEEIIAKNPQPENSNAASEQKETTPEKVNKKITLTVRAKKTTWMTVKQDGQVVFRSTLKLGTVETWMADKSIELSGKNISDLELELNGKSIGVLGKKSRQANTIVITKDGLSVVQ